MRVLMNRSVDKRIGLKFLGISGAFLVTLTTAGCGNQMYRQPSYAPLDTPRARPPINSVQVSAANVPVDGRPILSPAYGDLEASQALKGNAKYVSSFPPKMPDLPNWTLSENGKIKPAVVKMNAVQSPLPNDPRIVHAGHILFLNRCVECHNAGGYGYGTVGQYLIPHPFDLASFQVQRRTNGEIFWRITNGHGKMPGFGRWTTPTERWELTAYVRSLKHAPPPKNPAIYHTSTAMITTQGTPYPVYGLGGYQQGESAFPFKVLHPASSSASTNGRVINQGFGQPPTGPR